MANVVRRNEEQSSSRDLSQGRGYQDPHRRSYLDPFRMMGELLRWEPFAEFERATGLQGSFVPAVDVRETEDSYLFRVDLPGVKDENVDVSLTGNRLTISGHREEEKRHDSDRFHAFECSYGSFSRSFTLPDGTDPDNVRAEMNKGVLAVTVPKRPEVKPRRISLGQRSNDHTNDQGGGPSGQKS